MQQGNSSTFARLRPRSKMRILGSGTPRLKRDFGYGCIETLHLVSVGILHIPFFHPARHFVIAISLPSLRGSVVGVGVPCSCSSGSTSLDDEPLRRCCGWVMWWWLCRGREKGKSAVWKRRFEVLV